MFSEESIIQTALAEFENRQGQGHYSVSQVTTPLAKVYGKPIAFMQYSEHEDIALVSFKLPPDTFFVRVKVENCLINPIATEVELISDVIVKLAIMSDELSPDMISQRLGIQPTSSRLKGTRTNSRGRLIPATNHWQLEPQRDLPTPAIEKLQFLLDIIQPAQSKLFVIAKEENAEIRIYYHEYVGSTEYLTMNSAMLQQISATGCNLEIVQELPHRGEFFQ